MMRRGQIRPAVLRPVPALAVAVVLLAGGACGSDSGGGSPAPAPERQVAETRQFRHAFGTSTIPANPQRIVTTQDQNALLPLLELGVRPVGSAGLIDKQSGERRFRRTDGFDTSGIEFVGAYGDPNIEAVAALRPDLIVGPGNEKPEVAEKLAQVAPYVGVQIFGRSLTAALLDFGDLTGRADRARTLKAAYDARITEVKAALRSRHPGLTVTILITFEAGTFVLQDCGQAMGTVAHDLDLGRPAAHHTTDRIACRANPTFSIERLAEHDADVVFVVDYSGDGGTVSQELIAQPLWQQLQAAQRGQMHVIDGSVTVGAAWARMERFLDVLEQHLLVDGLVATGVNR
jgi:iron complex transport system substrate-binding protein